MRVRVNGDSRVAVVAARANLERVVRAVRLAGSLTQAEIARTTGLSAATVSNIVRELKDSGTVEVTPTSAGGRRARSVSLSGDAGIVIGVDFGHTHLRVAVGNLAHQVLAEESEPLDVDASAAQGFDRAEQLVSRLIAATGVDRSKIAGVGLGVPGPIDVESGTLGSTAILPGWGGTKPAEELRGRLGVPVHVDNDANLGALGELVWAAGGACGTWRTSGRQRRRRRPGDQRQDLPRPRRHGRRDRPHHPRRVGPRLPLRQPGLPGDLRLRPLCAPLLQPSHGTDLTMEGVVRLARDGDPGCRRVIADVGRHIGSGVANLCNLLNPSRVVLGGDLAEAGELVLGPIRESVGRYAIPSAARQLSVLPGALGAVRRSWGRSPSRSARWVIRPSWTEVRPVLCRWPLCLHLEHGWHRCHLVKDLLLDVARAAELTSSHLGRNDAASSGRFLK